MDKTMILKPRMSEKAYGISTGGVYVFSVPVGANKHSIANAVEAQFKVTVTKVNVANIAGKAKRSVTKRGRRSIQGRDVNVRKAYVSLKSGDSIPIFAAVEEAEAKSDKLEQAATKVAEKKAKKETE